MTPLARYNIGLWCTYIFSSEFLIILFYWIRNFAFEVTVVITISFSVIDNIVISFGITVTNSSLFNLIGYHYSVLYRFCHSFVFIIYLYKTLVLSLLYLQ